MFHAGAFRSVMNYKPNRFLKPVRFNLFNRVMQFLLKIFHCEFMHSKFLFFIQMNLKFQPENFSVIPYL
ncbi:hypothetical protein BOQ62_13290 [Chryseobacterium sp. CH21]|nr:hypothetical protein BOQ62_13290 [Chryseobacterium sp. CH21]